MTERASCVAVWLRTIVGLSSPMPYSVPHSTGWSKPDATSSADGGVETIWVGEERERLAGAATGCMHSCARVPPRPASKSYRLMNVRASVTGDRVGPRTKSYRSTTKVSSSCQ